MPPRVVPPRDNRAPHAIWHFQQEDFDAIIGGHSKDNLVENVLAFRIANQLSVGNPEADVENYYRRRYPERYYLASGPNQTFPPPEKERTALDEIGLKNKLWAKAKAKLVGKDEAAARATICAGCPSNVTVHEITICSPCVAQLNRDALILSGNRAANPDLRFCNALQHDNRVAVWMADENLDRSKKFIAAAPAQCWLRDDGVFPVATEVSDMSQPIAQDFERTPSGDDLIAAGRMWSLDPNPPREKQSIGPDDVGEMPPL